METQNHEKSKSECNRWRHNVSRDGMQIEMTFIYNKENQLPIPHPSKERIREGNCSREGLLDGWVSRPSVIQVYFVCLFFRCRQFFLSREDVDLARVILPPSE